VLVANQGVRLNNPIQKALRASTVRIVDGLA
jgi:hypothetical protein